MVAITQIRNVVASCELHCSCVGAKIAFFSSSFFSCSKAAFVSTSKCRFLQKKNFTKQNNNKGSGAEPGPSLPAGLTVNVIGLSFES